MYVLECPEATAVCYGLILAQGICIRWPFELFSCSRCHICKGWRKSSYLSLTFCLTPRVFTDTHTHTQETNPSFLSLNVSSCHSTSEDQNRCAWLRIKEPSNGLLFLDNSTRKRVDLFSISFSRRVGTYRVKKANLIMFLSQSLLSA